MNRLVLNGEKLLKVTKGKNRWNLSLQSKIGYQTVDAYIRKAESKGDINLSVLSRMFFEGGGLSTDEVLNLRLGDLFEVKEE